MIASKSPSYKPSKVSAQYVEECDDFLKLFPHRHDFIWAEHPVPGDRPDWRTESRHPLSDRLILQGLLLYGVRFGNETKYLMLDIDRGSAYHPLKDPFAVPRMVEALERIGLTSYVAISSSYSGGIHLYFPWGGGEADSPATWLDMAAAAAKDLEKSLAIESGEPEPEPEPEFAESASLVSPVGPLPCWAIAAAVEIVLESVGFKIIKGQLEIFPNSRKYDDRTTLYNAHRLPLQAGSYLLNADWEPIWTSKNLFVERWEFASSRNAPTRETIDQIIASKRKEYKRIGHTAQKFLNDLNAEIQNGWTGFGQTNNLIARIAIREYVFGHLFTGRKLQGIELQTRVLGIAIGLPGFRHFCKHVLEIAKRVSEWCNWIETRSKYYRYGGQEDLKTDPGDIPLSENEKRAVDAQGRIVEAVKALIRQRRLPESAADRIEAINSYLKASDRKGVSATTLYKYLPLWHPCHIGESPESLPDESLRAACEDLEPSRSPEPLPDKPLQTEGTNSFYAPFPDLQGGGAYGERAVGGSGGLSTAPNPPSGIEFVRQKLAEIRQRAAQRQVKRWQERAEIPPDENLFAQMRLSVEVVSE